MSIAGMPSIGCKAFSPAIAHGVNQWCKECLRDGNPFLLKELKQLVEVSWRWVMFLNPAPQLVPKVLNWVHIRAI